jgi:hypothetical protein
VLGSGWQRRQDLRQLSRLGRGEQLREALTTEQNAYDGVDLTVGTDIDEVGRRTTARCRPQVHQVRCSADVLAAAV